MREISLQHPIMVIGAGVTGTSVVAYCIKNNWPVICCDTRKTCAGEAEFKKNFPSVPLHLGDLDLSLLEQASMVIVSPGIDRELPIFTELEAMNIPVIGDVELFVKNCRASIIAITGSNGKSTVVDGLNFVLNQIGFKSCAAGNIGLPILDLAGQSLDYVVLELSSFQLESLSSMKAKVGCVLNLSADHLDRHKTLENYAQIKRRIYQLSKLSVYNLDDHLTYPENLSDKALSFGKTQQATVYSLNEQDGFGVYYKQTKLLSETQCQLKGAHNGLNLAAMIAILEQLNIGIDESVISALSQYSGLKHRCNLVAEENNIAWINDSKATNVGAAVAAIQGFAKQYKRLLLIAGGDAKGADLSEMSDAILQNVAHTWVFGKDAKQFLNFLASNVVTHCQNLEEIVASILNFAKPGDCVLFSPACASLDMYKNYQERGEHFISLVNQGVKA